MEFEFRKDLKVVFILFLLTCVFFWKVIVNPDKIIFDGYFSDVISQFSPYKNFISDSFRKYGELPLWNPYSFMGHPFVGNPVSAMFYPFNFLYLIINANSLFGFHFMFDVFVLGIGTYLLTRELKLDRFSSLVSSITFMFSGITVARVYAGHIPNFDIVALTPFVFWLLEIAIRKRSLFYGALTGIPLGLQFLAGQAEFALYSSFGLFIYFIFKLFMILKKDWKLKNAVKPISILAIAVIVAVCLSAIQVIPSLELSKNSARSGEKSFKYSTSYSFPSQQIISFAMPEFFGTFLDESYWGARNFWELTAYVGVLPLILCIVGLIFKRNEHSIGFLILALFSLLVAFGKYSPIFYVLYKIIPIFSMFRMPSVFLFITSFSLSVLAGFGSNFLIGKTGNHDRRKFLFFTKILSILILLVIFSILIVFIGKNFIINIAGNLLPEKYQEFTINVHSLRHDLNFYIEKIPLAYSHIFNGLIILAVFMVSSACLFFLRLSNKINIKYLMFLLILIIIADLWFFGLKYIQVKQTDEVFNERIQSDMFKSNGQFRTYDSTNSLPNFIAMKNGVEMIDGYDPTQLKSYRNFLTFFFGESSWEIGPFISIETGKVIGNPEILGLLNVKYVLTDSPIESKAFDLKLNMTAHVYEIYEQTKEIENVYVYENTKVLPRAFVVPDVKIIKDEKSILSEMNSTAFNPSEYAIIEKDIDKPLINYGNLKEAEITYYSPNEIHIKVKLTNPGFLVLSENWYPGWKAYDNGVEKEIYKTDYILRSIYLESGLHEINFVYKPLSFRVGAWISIITIFCICGVVIYKIKKR